MTTPHNLPMVMKRAFISTGVCRVLWKLEHGYDIDSKDKTSLIRAEEYTQSMVDGALLIAGEYNPEHYSAYSAESFNLAIAILNMLNLVKNNTERVPILKKFHCQIQELSKLDKISPDEFTEYTQLRSFFVGLSRCLSSEVSSHQDD
jgi:hypothetical protein